MSELILIFGVAAALAALLANIGIWSPRRLWIKLCAVAAAALFLPTGYLAMAELLSRPKPVTVEWAHRHVPEAVVLGSRMVEDKAIFLWLGFDGVDEPRAYTLPWNQNMARQLHEAGRQAEAEGAKLMIRQPFEQTMDRLDPVFYPEPHEALPPKQTARSEGPLTFESAGRGVIADQD